MAALGEWDCAACTCKNPMASLVCSVCDTARPPGAGADGPPRVGADSNPGQPPPSAGGPEWQCSHCPLRNPAHLEKCDVCEAPRPEYAGISPQQLALAIESQQRLLDAAKGSSGTQPAQPQPVVPQKVAAVGEWDCPTCTCKNPMASLVCSVCDAAKPLKAGSPQKGASDKIRSSEEERMSADLLAYHAAEHTAVSSTLVAPPQDQPNSNLTGFPPWLQAVPLTDVHRTSVHKAGIDEATFWGLDKTALAAHGIGAGPRKMLEKLRWLQALPVPDEHRGKFVLAGIDEAKFLTMDLAALKALGIPAGPRKRLLAVQQNRGVFTEPRHHTSQVVINVPATPRESPVPVPVPNPSGPPPAGFPRWLQELPLTDEQRANFVQEEIDEELFLTTTTTTFKQLGINTPGSLTKLQRAQEQLRDEVLQRSFSFGVGAPFVGDSMEISPNSKEFYDLVTQFQAWYIQNNHADHTRNRTDVGLLPLAFKLKAATKVRNPVLSAKFAAKKAELTARHDGDKKYVYESVSFHGSNPNNIPSILKTSLLPFKHPDNPAEHHTDPGYFGNCEKGVYVSKYANYCFKYCNQMQPLGPGQAVKVIMFKTLVGKSKHMEELCGPIDPTPGFDSHTSPHHLEWFVFDEAQLLPAYVLTVEAVEDTRTMPDE